jgi:serine/threonine-protein kinase
MTDVTPTNSAVPAADPPKKGATTVTAGTLIMGTYEIEQLINSGGMGEVYRGRNIHNDEPVAIKIVLPALAHDPKIVALFQKESTVLSRLAHEAIVRYHVFTNDPTIGRPCMVMEFVSGQALSDRIEQGPMPLEDVKTMLRRVASGLDKAHRAGVVHRDLSPDNVILEDGLVEHAKLIDFGIAKSSNFGSGTLLQGQFAGKFNWVSPEQLGAYGGQVDGRSDIYSLALITAAASKGAVLPMGASIVDAVSKRSSVPDLAGVDPALVPLLAWMLQPDPAQRADGMARVIAALDNPALLPQPVADGPAAPDPNRTVIEPLPIVTIPPRPQTAPPDSWQSRPQTTPPEGATVIAAQPVRAPEDDLASPFGAPGSAIKPSIVPPAIPLPVVKKGGKGGLFATAAILAVLGGGAGAWYSGLLGQGSVKPSENISSSAPDDPAAAEKVAQEQRAAEAAVLEKAAADKIANEKIAADKIAADQAAAKAAADLAAQQQAEADAEAKAAADKLAAETAAAKEDAAKAAEQLALQKQQAAADAKAAADTAAKTAQTAFEAAKTALAEAQSARDQTEAAAKDLAAAKDSATATPLADTAAKAAAQTETAMKAIETARASIAAQSAAVLDFPDMAKDVADHLTATDAMLAEAKGAAASARGARDQAAAGVKSLLDAEAAKAAEAQAKADQAADPVTVQQAHFDKLTVPACTYLSLDQPSAAGFALSGYAVTAAPLEKLATNWQTGTKVKPALTTRLINDAQCAVLDFMTANRAQATVQVTLADPAGIVKSGTAVEGTISGLNGRPFSVFLVNGAGGATNIAQFITTDPAGVTRFKFAPRMKNKGAPPSPQLLVVLVTNEAMAQALAGTKPNVIIGQLLDFVNGRLAQPDQAKAFGLGWYRLEN